MAFSPQANSCFLPTWQAMSDTSIISFWKPSNLPKKMPQGLHLQGFWSGSVDGSDSWIEKGLIWEQTTILKVSLQETECLSKDQRIS